MAKRVESQGNLIRRHVRFRIVWLNFDRPIPVSLTITMLKLLLGYLDWGIKIPPLILDD